MDTLPLDSPHWISLKAAIDAREKQTGNLQRAILDTEQAELPIMRQNITTGERKPVSAPLGKAYAIEYNPPFSLTVYRRTAIDDTPQRWGDVRACHLHLPTDRSRGGLFYVWGTGSRCPLFGRRARR